MSNKIRYTITAVFIVFSVWSYFTPYLAVSEMKSAAEAKDAARLSEYVNYPELKESLKASLNSTFSSEAVKKKDTDPFASLGVAMAAAFIDPMIDALVTPESLAMMMKGNTPQANRKNKASELSDVDFETTMGYENFDRFAVKVTKRDESDEPVVLIFNRDGMFAWKLSGVRLPL